MTYKEYQVLFNRLCTGMEEDKVFDSEIMYEIYTGMITPSVRKSYYANGGISVSRLYDFEDCVQDVFVHLWKKSPAGYFENPAYVKEPMGYLSWCKICISRFIISKVRAFSRQSVLPLDVNPAVPEGVADEISETAIDDTSDSGDVIDMIFNRANDEKAFYRESINTSFNRVTRLDNRIYMKVTWLAVFTLILEGISEDKIRAEHYVINNYRNASLESIYHKMLKYTENYEWLSLEKESLTAIDCALDEKDNGTPYRNHLLGEYLGEGDSVKKISDWIYKVNKNITKYIA